MVFPLNLALNASAEIADAANWPNFRLFTVSLNHSTTELNTVNGSWVHMTPQNIATFSAVCYMTARDVARMHTGTRPVGLIQSAWGGTRVEAWMSAKALTACVHPPITSRSRRRSYFFLWSFSQSEWY